MMFLKLLLRCSSSFISFFLLVFVSCAYALLQRRNLMFTHCRQHLCSVLIGCGHTRQENFFELHTQTFYNPVSTDALPHAPRILKVCFLANQTSSQQHTKIAWRFMARSFYLHTAQTDWSFFLESSLSHCGGSFPKRVSQYPSFSCVKKS